MQYKTYKLLLSVLAGVISLFINFFNFELGEGIYKVTLILGFILPLIVGLAWGWKYALLSSVISSISLFHLWINEGLGLITSIGTLTLWPVYHALIREKFKKSFLSNNTFGVYIAEIPYRVFTVLMALYVYNALLGLNDESFLGVELIQQYPNYLITRAIIKRLINSYIMIMVADFILTIPLVERIMGIERADRDILRMKYVVILATFLVIILFWIIEALILTAFTTISFADSLILNIPVAHLFTRILFILICFLGATISIELLKKMYEQNKKTLLIEKKANASEKKYKNLFENMTVAFAFHEVLYDESGNPYDYKYIEVNPTFENLTGLSAKEIIGKTVKEVLPETEEFWIKAYSEVAMTGKSKQFERFSKALNKYYDVFVFSSKRGYFSVIFNDVTDRVKAQLISRENEEKLRITFENIGDAIIVFDNDLHATMTNNAACEIIHWPQEKCIGLHADEIFTKKHFFYEGLSMSDLLSESISKNKILNITDAKFHCMGDRQLCDQHAGKDFYIEDSISPIIDDEGETHGVVIVFRDITEKVETAQKTKLLEDQLIQSQKMEALGQFSGGIAHDFNNIVTAINGYADLALERNNEKDEKMTKYLQNIKASGERSAELTKKILAFSRQQIIKTEVIDINKTIEVFLDLTNRITGEDIEVITEFSANRRISANVNQIERIILNLLSNAKDAINERTQIASEKKIILETKDVNIDNNEFIELSVSDSGMGIRKEHIDRIFEPFFTTKQEEKGSGMGLATVYGIVHQNNGQIKVYSEREKGTTFKIFWPASDDEHLIMTGVERKIVKKKRDDLEKVVLIVEDEDYVRNVASEFLSEKGFIVYAAENGRDALNKFNFEEIDLIVTDVIMPKMNGKEFVDKVRETKPNIDVLFTSGYTKAHIVENGIITNGIEFLSKPYDLNELLEKVDEILGNTTI